MAPRVVFARPVLAAVAALLLIAGIIVTVGIAVSFAAKAQLADAAAALLVLVPGLAVITLALLRLGAVATRTAVRGAWPAYRWVPWDDIESFSAPKTKVADRQSVVATTSAGKEVPIVLVPHFVLFESDARHASLIAKSSERLERLRPLGPGAL